MIRARLAAALLLAALVAVPGQPEWIIAKMAPRAGDEIIAYLPQIGVTIFPGSASSAALFGAEWVERDSPLWVVGCPDDPLYPDSWHLAAANVPGAWRQTLAYDRVVAVVDTGANCNLPEFACVPGRDVFNNDDDPADDHGHGTAVASTAAAVTDNGTGIAGVAWGTRVMPVKVSGDNGLSSNALVTIGIVWAVVHGADVINISMGGPTASRALEAAVVWATSQGVPVVAAAGNLGNDSLLYPAAYESAVTVGATGVDGARAEWSSFGEHLDLMAPGEAIWAANRDGEYGMWTGTSMSAPLVAGAIALAQTHAPHVDPVKALVDTARDMEAPGHDAMTGWGLIDVAAAVDWGPPAVIPAARLNLPVALQRRVGCVP